MTTPSWENIQVHASAAAAPGMICGRKSSVRDAVPRNFDLSSRSRAAMSSAAASGSSVKKMIRKNELPTDVSSFGSVKTRT